MFTLTSTLFPVPTLFRSSVMDEWAPQRRFRTFPACPVPRASAPPRARANPLEFPRPKTTSSPMQGDEDILTVTLGVGAAGLRLDRALADALPNLSRERLKPLKIGRAWRRERGGQYEEISVVDVTLQKKKTNKQK